MSPVQAVGKAFKLLNDYIGRQPNIKTIRFEWICDGELAPGFCHRNRHVLPAPFFENPDFMTSTQGLTDRHDQLLCLPYILHLSLKNCWVPPHALLQTVRRMALLSLEALELESVSLSGPPTAIRQPPLADWLRYRSYVDYELFNDLDSVVNTPSNQLATETDSDDDDIPGDQFRPKSMLWTGIMEHFSPRLDSQRDQFSEAHGHQTSRPSLEAFSKYLPDAIGLTIDQPRYRLKSVSFKSCGYVAVDLPHINSEPYLPVVSSFSMDSDLVDGTELVNHMQRCRDKRLGYIIQHINRQEVAFLEHTFGMAMGWKGIYNERRIEDALADGVEHPGSGRFSGTIDIRPAP